MVMISVYKVEARFRKRIWDAYFEVTRDNSVQGMTLQTRLYLEQRLKGEFKHFNRKDISYSDAILVNKR